jgi:hypothetical protein
MPMAAVDWVVASEKVSTPPPVACRVRFWASMVVTLEG